MSSIGFETLLSNNVVCNKILEYLTYNDLDFFLLNSTLYKISLEHINIILKLRKEQVECLMRVTEYDHFLSEISRQSHILCLEAILNDPFEICFVKKQTKRTRFPKG